MFPFYKTRFKAEKNEHTVCLHIYLIRLVPSNGKREQLQIINMSSFLAGISLSLLLPKSKGATGKNTQLRPK